MKNPAHRRAATLREAREEHRPNTVGKVNCSMKIMGDDSITRLENKPNSKCRKWRLRAMTDQGEKAEGLNGTYSQAEEVLRRFVAELNTPISETTFGDHAETWLTRSRLRSKVVASTLLRNRDQIKLVNSKFGGVRLADLTKPIIEDGMPGIKHGDNPSKKAVIEHLHESDPHDDESRARKRRR